MSQLNRGYPPLGHTSCCICRRGHPPDPGASASAAWGRPLGSCDAPDIVCSLGGHRWLLSAPADPPSLVATSPSAREQPETKKDATGGADWSTHRPGHLLHRIAAEKLLLQLVVLPRHFPQLQVQIFSVIRMKSSGQRNNELMWQRETKPALGLVLPLCEIPLIGGGRPPKHMGCSTESVSTYIPS